MRAPTLSWFVLSAVLVLCSSPSWAGGPAEVALGWNWDQVAFQVTPDGLTECTVKGASLRPGLPGEPSLPAYLVRIEAPEGSSPSQFGIVGSETSTRALTAPLAPVLRDAPIEMGGPTAVDPAAYAYEAPSWPAERVKFLGISLGRGRSWANFAVYPLLLEDGANVSLLQKGTLAVSWRKDATVPAPRKCLRDTGSTEFSRISPLAAPQQFSAKALATAPRPSLASDPVSYVVLTNRALTSAIEPFVDWKNQSGTPTAVRTVEWVDSTYTDGVDQMERIRNFLIEAYQYWGTEWLLIVGGPNEVPVRTLRSYTWACPVGMGIISDIYYAGLDGTWNNDGNAIFGEGVKAECPHHPVGDGADFDPELYVGRIPATSAAQVTTFVDKYLTYVKDPVLDGYLDKMLFLGEVLFDSDWTREQITRTPPCLRCEDNFPTCSPCVRLDGAKDCVSAISIIEDADDLNPQLIEMYEWYEYWKEAPRNRVNAVIEKSSDVVAQLNQGVGFIHHVGHGAWDRMSIGTQGGSDGQGRFVVGDARQMANGQRLSVLYSINCNSAAFDLDCLAEAMLFSSGGGVVTYIGSTNLDFPAAATSFQNGTYTRLFGANRVKSIGAAFFGSIAEQMAVWGDIEGYSRFLAFSLALLGDPQMMPWLETPKELTLVQGPTSMVLGDSTITVHVQRDGVNLEEAKVCAYKSGDTWGSAMTGVDGMAVVPFRPTSLGMFTITVTEPTSVPFVQADIPVQAAQSRAALALTELAVDDLTAAGPPQVQGNNDHRLDFGETVKLDVKIKNGGQVASSTLTLSLRIEPTDMAPWIEILDGTEEDVMGPLPGGTVEAEGIFLIRVRPGAPESLLQNGDRLPCQAVIQVEDSSSPPRILTFTEPLPAYRPCFDLEQGILAEVSGDGNGLPDDDETLSWRPVLRNFGAGTAANLTGVLTALSGATILAGSFALTQAVEGQTATTEGGALYQFHVTDVQLLHLQFEVKSTFNPSFSHLVRDIEFDKPGAPSFPTDRPPQATKDAILLNWSETGDADAAGYILERSATGTGGWTRIHDRFLHGMEYFRDEGLAGLTRYYYQVAAVDSSGNWSGYSDPVAATTNPALIAGWPINVTGDSNWGCPTIENLDATGQYEVFLAADRVYGFRHDGSEIIDGDGVSSTVGVWAATPTYVWSKPAIADIDGDTLVEVVVTARFRTDTDKNPHVFVWNREGDLLWSRPVGTSNYLMASPVLADIAGDGKREVIVHNRGCLYAWNGDGTPVLSANTDGKLAYVGGGNPGDPASWPYTYGSPAVADLDGDNKDEIVLQLETANAGSPSILVVVEGDGTIVATAALEQGFSGDEIHSNSSPSIADVDRDEKFDIFVATRTYLWCFNLGTTQPRSLVLKQGWPYHLDRLPTNWTEPTPAIGDVDGDGQLDVVVGSGSGRLVAVNGASGAALPGFPLPIADVNAKVGSPILVNLDLDNAAEIIVGDNQGIVHAVNGDAQGTPVAGFPYVFGGRIQHGLNLWDIDRNENPNLVIQAELMASIAILEIPDVFFPRGLEQAMALNPWTSFRHDARNTGRIDAHVITPVVLIEVEARAETGAAVLTWQTPAEPAIFRIDRQGSLGEWEVRGEGDPSTFFDGARYTFRDQAEPGRYLYRVAGFDSQGRQVYSSGEVPVTIQPYRLGFAGVVPNPFSQSVNIRCETPGGMVRLDILDLSGRRIRTLIDASVKGGVFGTDWDGRDDSGHAVRSGVYLAHLRGASGSQSVKVTLLR